MLPTTITLVRHGQSESNLAKDYFETGKRFGREEELMRVHTSERRLTPKGVGQAKAAGLWLRDNLGTPEELAQVRCYVSPYVRAMETAGHLGFGDDWRVDTRLMERNWGDLDQKSYADRVRLFQNELDYRKDYAFFWRPSNGETMQDVFLRTRDMLATLHRECEDKQVLMVNHGETMWVWRTVLERWLPAQLRDAMLSHDDRIWIHNCRIIQYTRFREDGTLAPRLVRMRMVNPSDPENPDVNLPWTPIERKRWSHTGLREYAEGHPCFMDELEEA